MPRSFHAAILLAVGLVACGEIAPDIEPTRLRTSRELLPGSCEGSCDTVSPDGCWCDDLCTQYGDCCEDYDDLCNAPPPTESDAAACDDGLDNDADGHVDCDDWDCDVYCPNEDDAAACSNGVDDDNDGYIDCDDYDCAAFCAQENDAATCANGVDDDNDGYVDCDDYDCDAFCPEPTPEVCDNGLDDDLDGLVDCDDADCATFCATEDDATACGNGVDDDYDGLVDCDDPDCVPFCSGEDNAVACGNGVDDDGDGYVDCSDWDCDAYCPDENDAAACSNGLDDDGDGYVDCVDYDCAPFCTEPTPEICNNGADDDDDGLVDCADPDCVALCTNDQLRVATYNIQSIGDPWETQYEDLVAIIERLAADVICLQEVEQGEVSLLPQLAADTGYAHFRHGEPAVLGGPIINACLTSLPILSFNSLSSTDLSTDPNANDVGRDILEMSVQVTTERAVTLFALHLKAGTAGRDRFRRQVELLRLGRRLEQLDATDVIVLGDINERTTSGAIGNVYAEVPTGMPISFQLGSDIELPLTYQPFATLEAFGYNRVEAAQEEAPELIATHIPTGNRIDFIFTGLPHVAAEVYEACSDDGVDVAPLGDVMPKANAPLACGTSSSASDHRPVMAGLGVP